VGKVVLLEVVLGREVVGFGFGIAAGAAGVRFVLVEVMRDGTEVVEEFAQQIPTAALAHDIGAEEFVPRGFDGLLEQDAAAVEIEIAESLAGGRAGAVVGAGCRGEPALVDAAAMSAERVEIGGRGLRVLFAGRRQDGRHKIYCDNSRVAATNRT
jgi:hypothetical protein